MNISIQAKLASTQSLDCLIYFIDMDHLEKTLSGINNKHHDLIKLLITRGDLKNKAGDTLVLPITTIPQVNRLVLISVGPNQKPDLLFKLTRAVEGVVTRLPLSNLAIAMDLLCEIKTPHNVFNLMAQTLAMSRYETKTFKTTAQDSVHQLAQVELLYSGPIDSLMKQVQYGQAIGEGVNYSKWLADLPANVCKPSYLSSQAIELAKQHEALSVEILDEDALHQLGMNAFLAVSKGSREPGQFIMLHYKGGKTEEAPYVLLGKGVTFDSGGISLKPPAKMDEMKFDMCGAASVMGVMSAMAKIKPLINVIGVIVSAENMPSGEAVKPSDIVTSLSGKTIEILNTDAEGRLMLCDGLTYIERFKPAAVIDIATLTGACISALGYHRSGLMSNDTSLEKTLWDRGDQSGDLVWPLPMGEMYDEQLKSNWADLANIGGPSAGTITAGCFLAQFAKSYPWAHLDIAGTAWRSDKNKGSTGRPVPLLANYLLYQAKLIS